MIEFINAAPDTSACARVLDRLRRRDASLWSDEPGVQRRIENRLGWLDAADFIDRHRGRIVAFAHEVRAEGYRQAALLGMGGSSLAPEVYAALFGGDAVNLSVVDSTSPRHVRDTTEQCARAATLFIVSSKSGATAETGALEAHFFEWARTRFDEPGRHFIAITDPDSPLQALAGERGYRDTFLNPPDVGGRFSALTFFGLIPAALSGVDPAVLGAQVPHPSAESPLLTEACRLGLFLGKLAREGRNKLSLQLGPGLAPLAAWIEQLIDESTGKGGTGIVVVPQEAPLPADRYSSDRVFVVVDRAGEHADAPVADLAALGHPVARWRLESLDRLGAELYRWEVATAVAGRELGINPFDEPDVNDSKAGTRALLERPGQAPAASPQTPSAARQMIERARAGDYLAVLAYLPPSPDNCRRLAEWSARLTRHTGLPCCIGFGPRYLHSSGQLHKGGPDQGLFIVLTLDSDLDVPIPGLTYGFKALIEAQARGDLRVLKERGRRVVHLAVPDDGTALDELVRSLP